MSQQSVEVNLSSLSTEERHIKRLEDLRDLVASLRESGKRIVLTSGTWDLLHQGHALYLERARSHGDILIVGVDSDEKTRARKGEGRPIVPESERLQMLTHQRHVDFVVVKELGLEKWSLIRLISPDTLIVTEKTYSDSKIRELETLCGQVVVLPRQAVTSTSARLRLMQIDGAKQLTEMVAKRLPLLFTDVLHEMRGGIKES